MTISARLGSALDGRVSLRAGALSGSRVGVVQADDANWGVAQAALRVRATDTSVGVGYRQVAQSLVRGPAALHNDLQAVDFTLAQGLPLPVLRGLGSDWRALFSVEFGKRREGEDEEKSNRRLAGGLALSF